MYNSYVKTPDKALCHLFLHCCFKDGDFSAAEIDDVSGKFVALELHKDLNFKDELSAYRGYRNSIEDEKEYVEYLIKLVNPTNEAALFSYCLELGLSDATLDASEKKLFDVIGETLGLSEEEQTFAQKLMVQRKVVETNKFF
jgi:hypothetical protein